MLSVFMTNDTAMRCLLDPFLDETCMFFSFEFSINTFSSPLISSNLYGETWRWNVPTWRTGLLSWIIFHSNLFTFFSSFPSSLPGNHWQLQFLKSDNKMESSAEGRFSWTAYLLHYLLLPSWFKAWCQVFESKLHDQYHNTDQPDCLYHVCH